MTKYYKSPVKLPDEPEIKRAIHDSLQQSVDLSRSFSLAAEIDLAKARVARDIFRRNWAEDDSVGGAGGGEYKYDQEIEKAEELYLRQTSVFNYWVKVLDWADTNLIGSIQESNKPYEAY
jgi:hypothetical protein